MKGNDGQTSAGLQRALGGFQALLQLFELRVQVDTDRLEGARRGIALLARAKTGGAANDRGKLGSTLDRTCSNDSASNCPGARLLPIVAQDPGNVGLFGRIQELGGGKARLAHAHVERTVALK